MCRKLFRVSNACNGRLFEGIEDDSDSEEEEEEDEMDEEDVMAIARALDEL